MNKDFFNFRKFISCSLIIAGTTIGAGMLGIPLDSYQAGFYPSTLTLFAGWLFMLITGYLFLEVSLIMPKGSNVLSISHKYIGRKGKYFSGGMFLFLYYCLLVAYFAAGAPLLGGFITKELGFSLSHIMTNVTFGVIFWLIVTLGVRWIDRANLLLITGVVISYILLVGTGSSEIDLKLLDNTSWEKVLLPIPVLFAAFGYHNVIPSMCTYCEKSRKTLLWALLAGTLIPLIFYLSWNWLTIGTVAPEIFAETADKGKTAASALDSVTGKEIIPNLAKFFSFFAIVTSLLGIALSMVDFINDGLSHRGIRKGRATLSAATFLPPCIIAILFPAIFTHALRIAGGIGEAYLNGLLPAILVFSMRYRKNERSLFTFPGGKTTIGLIVVISIVVMILEVIRVAT